jgi:protein SCO1
MFSKNQWRILVLASIIILPCLFWLFLIMGKNHFRKLEVFGPKDVNEKGDTLYHSIPSFTFINQDGKTISDQAVEGKIYVASFFFATCPTICPEMNENLKGVTENFKDNKEIKFLSFTVNPEQDSVPALKEYASKRNADSNQWWFLTGNKDSIYTLAREGYLVPAAEGKTAEDFFHSQDFILVDRENHIRGYYDGLDAADVKKLNEEIKVLLFEYKEREKSGKRLGFDN